MAAYLRPRALAEALAIRAERAERVAVVAGCTDAFPATARPALPGATLDLTGIAALGGVGRDGDGWRIGACATWRDIVRADLPPCFDGLKAAAREVGSIQIQNAGTIGGNLCNASPAADGVPCLLVLDAEVELASTRGTRRLALTDFLLGPRRTALAADEIMTAVLVPARAARGGSAFEKLGARRYLVISIAMVAARLDFRDGRVAQAAVAIGACSAVATRLPSLEAALTGAPAGPDLAGLATAARIVPALTPIDDLRADAGYRMEAAAELTRRALARIAGAAEAAA